MDDEVIPCGGTLILLGEGGAETHVTYVSDSSGPAGDPAAAEVRRGEAQRVREFLRFATSTELGHPDGRLFKHEAAIAADLADQLSRLKPDLLLCPFPADSHSDHMSCAACVADAARAAGWDGAIWAYEVWTPLWPNISVDISTVAERKERAIRLYGSQLDDRDYAAAALGLNRFRGLTHSVDFAEAFFECRPAEFGGLAKLLDRV